MTTPESSSPVRRSDDKGYLRTAIGLEGRKKAEPIYAGDAIVERIISLYKYLTDHRSR